MLRQKGARNIGLYGQSGGVCPASKCFEPADDHT